MQLIENLLILTQVSSTTASLSDVLEDHFTLILVKSFNTWCLLRDLKLFRREEAEDIKDFFIPRSTAVTCVWERNGHTQT